MVQYERSLHVEDRTHATESYCTVPVPTSIIQSNTYMHRFRVILDAVAPVTNAQRRLQHGRNPSPPHPISTDWSAARAGVHSTLYSVRTRPARDIHTAHTLYSISTHSATRTRRLTTTSSDVQPRASSANALPPPGTLRARDRSPSDTQSDSVQYCTPPLRVLQP